MSAIPSDKIASIISYNFRTFPRTIKLFAECFGIQTIEPIPKFRSKIVNLSGVIIGYIDYGKYNLQEFLNTLRCCVNNTLQCCVNNINGYMLYGDGRPIKTMLYKYKKCIIEVESYLTNSSDYKNNTIIKEYSTCEPAYYSGPETCITNSYSEITVIPVELDIWNICTNKCIKQYYTIKNGSHESYFGSHSVLDIPPDIVVSDNNIGDNITYKKIFAKESLPIILDY